MNYKFKGLLCYLLGWIPCVIILFCVNDNTRNEYFNAAQALVLYVLNIIISIVIVPLFFLLMFINPGSLFALILSLNVVNLVFVIMGCVKVLNEDDPKLPFIGNLTEKIFKSKLDTFAFSNVSNSNGSTSYNYDPNTGEKINKDNSNNWKYDPNTGEKIDK